MYTAAPHFQSIVIPVTPLVLKVPVQLTFPPGILEEGTGTAIPLRKISSSPLTGTVVVQVFVMVLKVVELQVAVGENSIRALGTAKPFPTPEIVELVKVIIAPVLGMPFAVKLAFSQIQSPELRGVPLKFDGFVDCAVQVGGGGVPQVRLVGENWMPIVLDPFSVAVPEKLKVPVNAGKGPQTEPLYVVEVAVKASARVIGEPEDGEISIV